MQKNKAKQFARKYITTSNVQIAILFIPLLTILIRQVKTGEWKLDNFLDTSILTSFLFAFICEVIAAAVSNWIGKKYEDVTKLTEDYSWLVKKYSREKLVEYKEKKFPVVLLAFRKQDEPLFEICLDHSRSNVKYELPGRVKASADWLMKAHEHSAIYNNMNVRADNILQEGEKITLTYSRTTYFDSLLTNRAMDYKWENEMTTREVYEPGPFLNCLKDSKLSNHLGFNGFIETADNKFIFVLRDSNLSIGKNTLANSIGASLKVKYCLDDDRKLTQEGLNRGIQKEIEDELKIKIDDTERLVDGIFAFYRDLVEGGKPQFLFYYKLKDWTAAKFEENFRDFLKRKQDKKDATIDGKKFLCLTLQELKECEVHPDKLILTDGQTYKMMPSASASLGLLMDFLE